MVWLSQPVKKPSRLTWILSDILTVLPTVSFRHRGTVAFPPHQASLTYLTENIILSLNGDDVGGASAT